MSYWKSFHLQSSFFAHFMCFEVPALNPPGSVPNGNKSVSTVDDVDDDDLGIMDIDDNDSKTGSTSAPNKSSKCLMFLFLAGLYSLVYMIGYP